MRFKLRTSVKVTTRVHCPSCKTPFAVAPESPSESLSARCPRCGATVTIPTRDVLNELNARVAELGVPPSTAQTPGANRPRVWAGTIILIHWCAWQGSNLRLTPRYYNMAPVRMATPTTSSATPSSVTATMW